MLACWRLIYRNARQLQPSAWMCVCVFLFFCFFLLNLLILKAFYGLNHYSVSVDTEFYLKCETNLRRRAVCLYDFFDGLLLLLCISQAGYQHIADAQEDAVSTVHIYNRMFSIELEWPRNRKCWSVAYKLCFFCFLCGGKPPRCGDSRKSLPCK